MKYFVLNRKTNRWLRIYGKPLVRDDYRKDVNGEMFLLDKEQFYVKDISAVPYNDSAIFMLIGAVFGLMGTFPTATFIGALIGWSYGTYRYRQDYLAAKLFNESE